MFTQILLVTIVLFCKQSFSIGNAKASISTDTQMQLHTSQRGFDILRVYTERSMTNKIIHKPMGCLIIPRCKLCVFPNLAPSHLALSPFHYSPYHSQFVDKLLESLWNPFLLSKTYLWILDTKNLSKIPYFVDSEWIR